MEGNGGFTRLDINVDWESADSGHGYVCHSSFGGFIDGRLHEFSLWIDLKKAGGVANLGDICMKIII